jgi:hypothetical protein
LTSWALLWRAVRTTSPRGTNPCGF